MYFKENNLDILYSKIIYSEVAKKVVNFFKLPIAL